MALVGFSFIVMFALIFSGGMLLFYRQAILRRLSDVVPQQQKAAPLKGAIQQTGTSIGSMVGNLGQIVPKSEAERSTAQSRLVHAGYRTEAAIRTFYGVRIALPLMLLIIAATTGLLYASPILVCALSLAVGILVPKYFLSWKARARKRKLRHGLPDALDLLVICIEAGLGIDQATSRTAEELKLAHPVLGEELSLVMLELRAGRPRSEAWQLFAERTGVDAVRALATALVQAEQLGTGLAKTLRIHAESLRTERRQIIEEKAAKTSVKLVFPLVLFIFPSLFLVTLGPEAILMAEAFQSYFPH